MENFTHTAKLIWSNICYVAGLIDLAIMSAFMDVDEWAEQAPRSTKVWENDDNDDGYYDSKAFENEDICLDITNMTGCSYYDFNH